MSIVRSKQNAGDLAEEHRPWLMRRARKLCGNAPDAEDLVQDAITRFLTQCQHARALPDPEQSGRLLTRILANAFNDLCRRRKVRDRNAEDPLLGERLHAVPRPPEPSHMDSVTPEQVDDALRAFSPLDRKTYKLLSEGEDYEEIAIRCGGTPGAARTRVSKIRAKLRALFTAGRNG
ncbi:sigma-70 family RNA polymerase sigma factor [Myxococcus sp. K15C18031901]|uniref:RNA polymerase sigma factor n=1 Tax=Myxococcus dinghuensis TaxID=2906761 RepID=UPI0020A7EF1C|nr:sigma-70 family RNA polymerase sigma factor [Myxococcus dinghuensis]MCP3102786.1 sigma-70 family RNA polymerase sigma factor [Myxococcus dinghuensis]